MGIRNLRRVFKYKNNKNVRFLSKKQRFVALFFVGVMLWSVLLPHATLNADKIGSVLSDFDFKNILNNFKSDQALYSEMIDRKKAHREVVTREDQFDLAAGSLKADLAPTTSIGKQTAQQNKEKITDRKNLKKDNSTVSYKDNFTRVYQGEEGGQVIESSSHPLNYKNENNKLESVEHEPVSVDSDVLSFNTSGLKLSEEGLANTKGDLKVHYGPIGVADGGITIGYDESALKMIPADANKVSPKKDKKSAQHFTTYKNVWKDIDLTYEYKSSSLKESIIINSAKASNVYKFDIDGARLSQQEGSQTIDVEGDLKGKISFGELSVNVNKIGIISNPPVKQYVGDNGTSMTVELDRNWLQSQGKDAFPIVIDPSAQIVNYIAGGTSKDYVAYKNDGYACGSSSCYVNTGGLYDNGNKYWRTVMNLPYSQASGRQLLSAYMYLPMSTAPGFNGTYNNKTIYVNWASCSGYNCVGSGPTISGTVGADGTLNVTSLIQWMLDNKGTSGKLIVRGEANTTSFKVFNDSGIRLYLNTNRHPSMPTPELPSTSTSQEASVTTPSPQLKLTKVTDPDGDKVHYQFIVKNTNGNVVWSSSMSPSRQVTIPEGYLQDAGKYKWEYKYGEHSQGNSYWWISTVKTGGSFRVDLLTGKDDAQTYHEMGSLSVSLSNGNVYSNVNSHSLPTLGGSIGLNLDYNSPYQSKPGLQAEYFSNNSFSGKPQYRSVEPNVDYDWDLGSPVSGVIPVDNFSVRWTGFFLAPNSGEYLFGGYHDDTMTITIDGSQVYSKGCCGTGWSTTPVYLQEGQAAEIVIGYKEATSGAYAVAKVKGAVSERVIPTDWLRTKPLPADTIQGLTGHYYYDNATHNPSESDKFLVRNDPTVNFAWGSASPTPGAPTDNFFVRWEGYFTAPTTGTYKFGIGGDDGVRVRVDGVERASLWSNHDYQEKYDPNGFTLNEGQTVPIIVEYFDGTGSADVKLLLDSPNGIGVIDSQYLTNSSKVLPKGWSLSGDIDGGIAYERLTIRQNGDAMLYDSDGVSWLFANSGTGYKPPVNEDATLVKNEDGSHTLTDADGRVYVFDIVGTLKSTSKPIDDRNPAGLAYEYSTQNGQPKLKKIIDQVDASRYGTVYYGGDSGCRAPYSGLEDAPAGMLCGFETTDGRYTQFMYYNGRMVLVNEPGYEDTTLVYSSNGTLAGYRDSSTEEAIYSGQIPNDDNSYTWIWYDALGRSDGMESHKPSPSLDRTMHWIQYLPNATKLHHLNSSNPAGYTQYVEFDNKLRTTKACDNTAKCSTTTYDSVKDIVLSSTDPLNLMTTTIYDDEDRPVSSYGPAPKEWFGTDRKPLSTYVSQVPRSDTRYDESIVGPLVAYYEYEGNVTPKGKLFGSPKLHTTGINASSGILQNNWISSPISVSSDKEGWGASLSGKLRLPSSGTYQIKASHDDGVKVWVDDKLVVDSWSNGAYRDSLGSFTYTAGTVARFRVDYYTVPATTSGDASLNLYLKQNSGFDWTADWSNYLKPGYGLSTSTTTYDSQLGNISTETSYLKPEYGLIDDITVDPNGLDYTTSVEYENGANSLRRQVSQTSMGGSTTQYIHWGATDVADNPCTSEVEAYKQAGFIKGKISPDPDGSGPQQSLVSETRYDDAGRVIATKVGNDPWTCMWYEDRGRMTYMYVPTVGDREGRETWYNYWPNGNPLKTEITDSNGTTTTTVDLFDRTVAFEDVHGNLTTTQYDSQGLVSGRTSKLGSESYIYDSYGRLTTYKLDGVDLSTISYDEYGRVTQIDYPTIKNSNTNQNLKVNTPVRDQLQRINEHSYTLPSGDDLTSSVNRSQSGVILDESVNGVDLSPGAQSFVYDKAGRLTVANVAGNTFNYGFGSTNTACSNELGNNPNAASNFNRTSYAVNGGQAEWYCYDFADRLIASSDERVDDATYDNHGNTLTLGSTGSQTVFTYDQSDRNTRIQQGTVKTEYERDHDNRIYERRVTDSSGSSTYYYGSTGSADYSFMYTNNSTKEVVEKYLTLPGGVSLTIRPLESNNTDKQKVSIPDIRGNTIIGLDGEGNDDTGILLYEPFGEKIGVSSSFASNNPSITFAANTIHPDNMLGGQSRGWAGSAKRGYENNFDLRPMQMGARVYIPTLGRFLSVDPVEGGTPNDYVYAVDPINQNDYSGEFIFIPFIAAAIVKAVIVAVAVVKVVKVVKTVLPSAVRVASSIARTASRTYSSVSSWTRAWTSNATKTVKSATSKSSTNKRTSPPVNKVKLPGPNIPNTQGIYNFKATSGKTYIGKSVNPQARIMQHERAGRYPGGNVNVTSAPSASPLQLRVLEQNTINRFGGLKSGKLDNKINSVAERYWDDLDITPPM